MCRGMSRTSKADSCCVIEVVLDTNTCWLSFLLTVSSSLLCYPGFIVPAPQTDRRFNGCAATPIRRCHDIPPRFAVPRTYGGFAGFHRRNHSTSGRNSSRRGGGPAFSLQRLA
jgi:hypothetical protein